MIGEPVGSTVAEADGDAAPLRILVASQRNAIRDWLLSSPQPGVETVVFNRDEIIPDTRVEVVVIGGAAPPIARILEVMPNVRWIHSMSAGMDRFLPPELVTRDDIILTNSAGAHAASIGEFILSAVFLAAKRFPGHARNQANHEWPDSGWRSAARSQRLLRDSTVVVVGPGHIGREFTRLAKAIGMKVVAVRRRPGAIPEADRTVTVDRLPEEAAEADFLVVAAASTPASHGIVSRAVIDALPAHAWIVNVGRGAIVDEAALMAALTEGRIGGAVLDTVWQEPLPPDSRWWDVPNAVITGHTAATAAGTDKSTIEVFAENLRRYRGGEELLNVVDKREGY
jgi:phosphoglycerate dehydrogenase-like enzyme